MQRMHGIAAYGVPAARTAEAREWTIGPAAGTQPAPSKLMAESKRPRWSWQIGGLFGISIRVHVTLLALLLWVAIAAPIAGARPLQAFAQVALVVSVFACIVIHELAHALVARRFGCRTREILLLPIGGIAQMERVPERPAQELLVGLAGPATNIVIAGVLGAVIAIVGWPFDPDQPSLAGSLIVPLFWSNVALAGFNLLPAFPLDGGRVLRAMLTARLGRQRATLAASTVGKVLAIVFVIAGLTVGGTMLAIIGVFVWFAAEQESATVMLTSMLSTATVADAMIRSPHVVDAEDPIDEVAKHMIADGQRDLAVAEHGRVAGTVSVVDIAQQMSAASPHGAVGSAMHRDVAIVQPMTPLVDVLDTLERRGVLLVGDQDTVIGMLTTEQLATFAALQGAVH